MNLSERFKFHVFREERPEDPKSKSTTSTMTGENTSGKYSVCAQYVHLTRKKRIGTIENVYFLYINFFTGQEISLSVSLSQFFFTQSFESLDQLPIM